MILSLSHKNELVITEFAEFIASKGGRVYYVGGFVRDSYLGKTPKDIDLLVTGFTLYELEKLIGPLGVVHAVGKSFGVLKFTPHSDMSLELDIAVPRKEITPEGSTKHTDVQVETGLHISIIDDLLRRDFTINSIAVDVLSGSIIDPHGGVKDLEDKVIRCTNKDAFVDDPLRILRADSFYARLEGFHIEENTLCMCMEHIKRTKGLSSERVLVELEKIFKGCNQVEALQLLYDIGFLTEYIYHDYTIDWRDSVRPTKLFSDFIYTILRPTLERDDMQGSLERSCKTLSMDNKTAIDVIATDWLYELQSAHPEEIEVRELFGTFKIILKHIPDFFPDSIFIREDVKAFYHSHRALGTPFIVKELNIDGNDLKKIGLSGTQIGETLQKLLESVWVGEIENDREKLIEQATKNYKLYKC